MMHIWINILIPWIKVHTQIWVTKRCNHNSLTILQHQVQLINQYPCRHHHQAYFNIVKINNFVQHQLLLVIKRLNKNSIKLTRKILELENPIILKDNLVKLKLLKLNSKMNVLKMILWIWGQNSENWKLSRVLREHERFCDAHLTRIGKNKRSIERKRLLANQIF